jgi:hypothetical protein
VTNPGRDYSFPPTVTVVGANTTQARPGALISGSVRNINVITPGSGYSVPPVVTIVGGLGANANATASIVGNLYSISITNPGVGYVAQPNVTISGGGGAGALANSIVGSQQWFTVANIPIVPTNNNQVQTGYQNITGSYVFMRAIVNDWANGIIQNITLSY